MNANYFLVQRHKGSGFWKPIASINEEELLKPFLRAAKKIYGVREVKYYKVNVPVTEPGDIGHGEKKSIPRRSKNKSAQLRRRTRKTATTIHGVGDSMGGSKDRRRKIKRRTRTR